MPQNAVRTKYDRMFERKNQKILSEHYSKLVDHGDTGDEEEDFITLKRADHDLEPSMHEIDPDVENLSNRKFKLSRTKRMVAKYGQLGHKLVFDDDGNPHEVMARNAVKAAGRAFAEGEKGKLKSADVVDKQEAKEKKKEKKRKRKERERGMDREEVQGEGRAMLALSGDREDGYFDLPSENEEQDDMDLTPPPKRTKASSTGRAVEPRDIEDEEEMALRLLRRK
ncbi:hypothetical protein JVU11DRAFT_6120 [Chiua virens]|nr:hypothetical protein JVU11DRAFT_6120 [Chiua virens]